MLFAVTGRIQQIVGERVIVVLLAAEVGINGLFFPVHLVGRERGAGKNGGENVKGLAQRVGFGFDAVPEVFHARRQADARS